MDLYQAIMQHNPRWSPLEIRCLAFVLLVACAAAYLLYRGRKILLSQAVGGLLLLVALLMIFGTTLLTRASEKDIQWQLRLFWSWERVMAGSREMLLENVLNVALLLPVGFLLPIALHRTLTWWQGSLVGAAISVTIELGQLFWRRGVFELDDMVHNSVGCMIGCVLIGWLMKRTGHGGHAR